MKKIFLLFLLTLSSQLRANIDPIEVGIENIDIKLFRHLLDTNVLLRVEDKQRYIDKSEQKISQEIKNLKFKLDVNFFKNLIIGSTSIYLAYRSIFESFNYYNLYFSQKEDETEHSGISRVNALALFTSAIIFAYIGISRFYNLITNQDQKKKVCKAMAISGILNHIPVRVSK